MTAPPDAADPPPKLKLTSALASLFGVDERDVARSSLREEGIGWRLDCALTRASGELLLTLTPTAVTSQALLRGSHLSCSYRAAASDDDIDWLTKRRPALDSDLAAALAARISDGDPPAGTDPDDVVLDVGVESLDPGDAALQPVLRACGEHFGVHARIVSMKSAGHLPSVEFPAVPTLNNIFGAIGANSRSEGAIRSYINSIGFSAGSDGAMRTVPTPATFIRRCEALGITPAFKPQLVHQGRTRLTRRRWLAQLVNGKFLINVGGPGLYAAFSALRCARANRLRFIEDALQGHLTALGHDMGTHVFAVHRIPSARATEIKRRVAAALPQTRRAQYTQSLAPLADFFEGDLTYQCLDIWRNLDHPDAFAGAFDDAWPALEKHLSARIEACRRLPGPKDWL